MSAVYASQCAPPLREAGSPPGAFQNIRFRSCSMRYVSRCLHSWGARLTRRDWPNVACTAQSHRVVARQVASTPEPKTAVLYRAAQKGSPRRFKEEGLPSSSMPPPKPSPQYKEADAASPDEGQYKQLLLTTLCHRRSVPHSVSSTVHLPSHVCFSTKPSALSHS